MSTSRDIVKIVGSIVSEMTPVISISSVEPFNDGWKLFVDCTYWVTPSMNISIAEIDYKVVSVLKDDFIEVSSAIEPSPVSFALKAPVFEHGTHRKVDNERKNIKDLKDPFVYLPLSKVDTDHNPSSAYDMAVVMKPIFLLGYSERRNQTKLLQEDVIPALLSMKKLFFDILEGMESVFDDPKNVSEYQHPNFGDEAEYGKDKLIFEQKLSAIQTVVSVDVFKKYECDSTNDNTNTCEPSYIYRDDIFLQTLDSGKRFDFSTGDPANIQINGVYFSQALPSTDLNINVLSLDGNPLGEKIGANWVVPLSDAVFYNKPWYLSGNSTRDRDEFWYESMGINDYNNSIPSGSKIQKVDYSDMTKRDKLVYPNRWGHYNRFTGYKTGGFYENGLYYDRFGIETTIDLAFPVFLGSQRLIVDNLSGAFLPNKRGGQFNWQTAIDLIISRNDSGYYAGNTGLILPNDKAFQQLLDSRFERNLDFRYRPPFDMQVNFDLYWSSSSSISDPENVSKVFDINVGMDTVNVTVPNAQVLPYKHNFLTGTVQNTIVNED